MRTQKRFYGIVAALIIIGILLTGTLAPAAEMQKINLNSADKAQLMTLSGVGEKVAMNIIAYREKNGPFKASEDVMKVKGVGPKTMAKNKGRIFVTPAQMPMKRK